jgi:glycosyltransferase involved in cell wall biosynthesis
MRKLKLGVIFDQEINIGGGFQQSVNSLLLTQNLSKEYVECFYFTTKRNNLQKLNEIGIKPIFINYSFFQRVIDKIKNEFSSESFFRAVKIFFKYSSFEKLLLKHEIDLVYFLSPCFLASNLEKINYIITIWDLCHRDELEFPEVRWNKKFEGREKFLNSILPKATAILVDSSTSKLNIINRYRIDEDRIYTMPFEAAVSTRKKTNQNTDLNYVDIKKKYNLNFPYIYYPAQFWPHKNHIYILEGVSILESQYKIKIGVIFSGSDKGNKNYIQNCVNSLELEERVRFVGFVSDDEIPFLYKQSIALVMPTYFGPTNLPPIEAFELGIPILYSDIKGARDQVGEAALYLDLMNPNSMALSLKRLIENFDLRDKLITNGYNQLKSLNSVNRIDVLTSIIQKYYRKRICWPQ